MRASKHRQGSGRKTSKLTDTALRNFKQKAAPYKASGRDGMYVTASTEGTIAFRYGYRLNGRREKRRLTEARPSAT